MSDKEAGRELIEAWRRNPVPVIPTSDLDWAAQYLDQCVDLLCEVQAAGVECTAEMLTLGILADTDVHRESRTSLMLAIALQRLAAAREDSR